MKRVEFTRVLKTAVHLTITDNDYWWNCDSTSTLKIYIFVVLEWSSERVWTVSITPYDFRWCECCYLRWLTFSFQTACTKVRRISSSSSRLTMTQSPGGQEEGSGVCDSFCLRGALRVAKLESLVTAASDGVRFCDPSISPRFIPTPGRTLMSSHVQTSLSCTTSCRQTENAEEYNVVGVRKNGEGASWKFDWLWPHLRCF